MQKETLSKSLGFGEESVNIAVIDSKGKLAYLRQNAANNLAGTLVEINAMIKSDKQQ